MIPFNRPCLVGDEERYLKQALASTILHGNGPFTQDCESWLKNQMRGSHALLVHSGTAALELAALLIDVQPGDEIIMPSYTFVSTANAFVLRGGVPVFVDIDPHTLNLDPNRIEAAITSRTKAIVPVHYAGVACDMAAIMTIAQTHQLYVIEDAAQALMASYQDKPLGGIGHLGCFSFHDTKNIISGEGGALIINDPQFIERAEILREKGTNRSKFFRGEVDKYSWIDKGSSYLPNELTAAFLYAQLQKAAWITSKRQAIWDHYHAMFESLELLGSVKRPTIPDDCQMNGHLYYLLLDDNRAQRNFIQAMAEHKIQCTFHYVPLHDSLMGQQYCKTVGDMTNTESCWKRIVRLPLYHDLSSEHVETIITTALVVLSEDLVAPN